MPDQSSSKPSTIRTLRLRIKDKHAAQLAALARETNLVWNFCNELSIKVFERERRFISAYDIHPYTAGATKEGLAIHSQTVQAVTEEYVTRRKQFKKVRLNWRKSGGARRSLGWIPFKASAIQYRGGQIRYGKLWLSLWDSFGLANYTLGVGSISEDARGRWYLNVTASPKQAAPQQLSLFTGSVGIDLGLKEFAATSDGHVVEPQKFYRTLEADLAIAQRANKKKRVKNIHARIANQRKEFHHQPSRKLVDSYSAIFVGNVNASALAQTDKAKSVLDAGWSQFRTMLLYKCDRAGIWFEEVNEAYSTQTCSDCSAVSGPKSIPGLGIREWVCPHCNANHHRDVNAARNIFARGHARLAGGIPHLSAQAAAAG